MPRVGEVRLHGVTAAQDVVHETGVLGADVRHPDGGDGGEGQELGLDRTGDHG